jgi:hypothetical protein
VWVAVQLLLVTGCSIETHGTGAPDGAATDGGRDGGTDADAGCAPESCNSLDDDCDGRVDEDFDLSSPATCGGCDVSCEPLAPLCESGPSGGFACVAECSAGRTLCGTSCVDPDTHVGHCGGCGMACMLANATPLCRGGACEIQACDPMWDDCDSTGSTGCEADLTADGSCGACGVTCSFPNATASCSGSGTCAIDSCVVGFDDCDGDPANGCETTLGTDSACGACGDACPAGDSCDGGTCVSCPAACTCLDRCGTGGASCDCTSGCCRSECDGDCDATCSGMTTMCAVDAVDEGSIVDIDCRGGATCSIDARGGSNVEGRCREAMTDCTIDCSDGPTVETSNCDQIRCESGARCRIYCGTTSTCGFDTCHDGAPMDCRDTDGWITCGTGSCP